MNTLNVYNSVITSEINNIYENVNKIISILEEVCDCMDEDKRFELKVILNELLINAIKHGNKCDKNKLVKIDVNVEEDKYVIINIEDEGIGYNFNETLSNRKCCSENTDICELSESGRGVLIISNLCDEIKLNTKCNKVQIKKKIN